MSKDKKWFGKRIFDYEMKYWIDTGKKYKEEFENLKKIKKKYNKEYIKASLKRKNNFDKGPINISQEQYIEDIQTQLLGVMMLLLIISVIFSHLGIGMVSGQSMEPTLKDGDIVVYSRYVEDIEVGDIVIVNTTKKMSDNEEKNIKRVAKVTDTNVYLLGDNKAASKDSRTYGYVNRKQIEGRVLNYD